MGLDFDELQWTNVRRCEEVFHKLHSWSALEWAGAMCGEAGEAANKAKKLKRIDDEGQADKELDTPEYREQLADEIAEEAADAVHYADLLCTAVGRDLGAAVRKKFNEVSEKRGSRYRL